ncbi:tumor necrosis factor receptor superfamily member 14-like isoform X2 [Paralichthys olivaceus]|uniref:tumor necrosis factor receptor superfamily member 14-like isoform X2 n=1 Tax=Paralichthys olivaceus TaxID=8255 RepID=UPI003752575D
MNLRRKHLEAASLLILLIKVFCVNTLTCHPTEYLIGSRCCSFCPPGNRVETHCTEFRSTSCLPCEKDTFMNHPTTDAKCFPCTCGPDSGLKINTSCTATTDSVCEPLEGFYCTDRTRNNCAAAKKHTQCKPGQFIKQRGTALTDSECSDCSNGTFSDGTRTSCQAHTQCESPILQLKRPGTTSTDAKCEYTSLNVPVGIIASVVLFFFVLSAIAFVCWKRKICRSGKKRNPTEGNTAEGEMLNMMERT